MKIPENVSSNETRQTQLREMVLRSGDTISHFWPMRNFIHHNPLHSLEHLPFEEAVELGRQFLGGRGYLSCKLFREYASSGRILAHHINAALKPLAQDKYVNLGSRKITHCDLLNAHLLHGLSSPAEETLESLIKQHPKRVLIESLANHLNIQVEPQSVSETVKIYINEELKALSYRFTLASWCDRTMGTEISQIINRELIKWCGAFLDEGHAAWPMPEREKGFYGAWKFLAARERSPCAIQNSRQKIARLPENPEETLYEHLDVLGIPEKARQDYLFFHLAALYGWTGFIKWRAEQTEYEWQQAYPVDMIQYLAVRLWYERELVQKACSKQFGIDGNYNTISADMQMRPYLYFMMRERTNGNLPIYYTEEVDRLRYKGNTKTDTWETLAKCYMEELAPSLSTAKRYSAAWRLFSLSNALEIEHGILLKTPPKDLKILLEWLDAFPESAHGPVWLRAYEAGYREQLINKLAPNLFYVKSDVQWAISSHVSKDSSLESSTPGGIPQAVRPHAQVVFCIDIRSEPFRRHLEATGDYETFGFAGFFTLFIRYRALGCHHETDQYPVIGHAKHTIREVPRTYHGQLLKKYLARAQLLHAGHKLLHDLKENVITPYVMVESLGWFYGLPLVGKTFFKNSYRKLSDWFLRKFVPPIATTLTINQLSRYEAEDILAAEQRSIIHRALKERFGGRLKRVSSVLLEILRKRALGENIVNLQRIYGQEQTFFLSALDENNFNLRRIHEQEQSFFMSAEEEKSFLEELRNDYKINQRDTSERMERFTKIGVNFDDQLTTLENALRMMGLTKNFSRLVLFCAHSSTSENNPFEAALDCGACGGNAGSPNARLLAAIANRSVVRDHLLKKGISIPNDTYFIAGQHNTTTDEVEIFDIEDVPHTHNNDLLRLMRDLKEAGRHNSQERCTRFPDIKTTLTPHKAAQVVKKRSSEWNQIRPEWGLSGNAAFIIGDRKLSLGINFEGRVFLQSYDYVEDTTGQFLESIMNAPQAVGQWINMEHYFSTVDNEVYGSGSKVYHNVVGRLGIMYGPRSDLRIGLPWQTVYRDKHWPYHEPMRLFTIIEAPRERVDKIIRKHRLLQNYYDNEWVHLIVLEPGEKIFYHYIPRQGWVQLKIE